MFDVEVLTQFLKVYISISLDYKCSNRYRTQSQMAMFLFIHVFHFKLYVHYFTLANVKIIPEYYSRRLHC